MVDGLTYMGVNGTGCPSLGDKWCGYPSGGYGDDEREELSSDGMSISWKLNTDWLPYTAAGQHQLLVMLQR